MKKKQNGYPPDDLRPRDEAPPPDGAHPDPVSDADLVREFHSARRDPHRVVLEGAHPLKHALRFGAVVRTLVTPDRDALAALLRDLAPDALPAVDRARVVEPALFERLSPAPVDDCIALTDRPARGTSPAAAARADRTRAPWVLLEQPTHLGNIGAVVRVCAAADAAGVVATGRHDPWHPAALRGSAGLHFALPVLGCPDPHDFLDALADERPLVAMHPQGEPLARAADLPPGAVLAFGSERRGLSPGLLERAHRTVRLPMRAGVSSLNLATAVAATLYAGIGCRQQDEPPGG